MEGGGQTKNGNMGGKVITDEKKDRADRKKAEQRLKERKDQEEEERWKEARKKKDKEYAAEIHRRKAIDAEQERKKRMA